MKRLGKLSILLLLIIFMTACGSNNNINETASNEEELKNLNETGMPIVDEEITLKFFAGQAPATNDNWNDVLIFNEYEDRSNINIEWEMVPHQSVAEKRNLALSSGDLPDAFHSTGMPPVDILRYGQQGTFVELNDLIDEYAPNFKKILEDNPLIEQSVTMADGKIYSFPLISDPSFASHRIQARPFILEPLLEELDMDMPETTEEFYEFLSQVKDETDTVPFGGPYISTLVNYLRGSFGLANRGGSNNFIDENLETGDVRFFPIADEYKEMLEYLHKLYDEELIAQNIFSIDHQQFIANLGEQDYGSVVWFSPEAVASEEAGKDYIGMPVLEGPHGKTLTQVGSPVMNPGAFVITDNNEHVEATVRWIDYFYGEEGLELFFLGVEGETYEISEDGEKQFMDHILNSKEGLTVEQEQAKYLTFPGGGFPSIVKQELFQGTASAPQSLEASAKLEPDIIQDEDIWPILPHTKEENDKLQSVGADIEKYVTEMTDKFISGDTPLSEWDSYVSELEKMGLDEYLEIKNEALNRLQAN